MKNRNDISLGNINGIQHVIKLIKLTNFIFKGADKMAAREKFFI